MAERYTTAEKAAIFMAFPDDLKKAIGEYEPLEEKTLEELHAMLIEIRQKFDLAPWHNFTRFMKILGSGKRHGCAFERQNRWTIEKEKYPSNYCNKSCQWVTIRLEVGRGPEVGTDELYVCPSKQIIWNAATESQIQRVMVPVCSATSRRPRYVMVPSSFVFTKAAKHLATLGESHGPVNVYYNVSTGSRLKSVEAPKEVAASTQEVQHKETEKRESDTTQRWGWNLLLQRLQKSSDREQAFLQETIEASPSPEEYLETHNLYLRYRTWALERGYRPVSEHMLNATIVLMHPSVLIDRRRIGNRRPTVAYGITWLTAHSKAVQDRPDISCNPACTPVLDDSKTEMLRTMFEIACVKLRELGMESTIERWSKQLNQYIGETP